MRSAVSFPAGRDGNGYGAGYPARPVRMIIPFPAGGGADVFGQVLFRCAEIAIEAQ